MAEKQKPVKSWRDKRFGYSIWSSLSGAKRVGLRVGTQKEGKWENLTIYLSESEIDRVISNLTKAKDFKIGE